MIGDRPFVNNASFGAYAEIVQSPEYRDNKNRTMLEMLPDLLSGQQGARPDRPRRRTTLDRSAGGAGQQQPLRRRAAAGPGPTRPARPGHPGCDRRHRMASTAQAVGLLRRAQYRSVTRSTGDPAR